MLREFSLPKEDVEHLSAKGYEWETTRSDGTWLLINNFPIPDGYNVPRATCAINLSAYAPGPIDMAYFYPSLSRIDGQIIRCTEHMQTIRGLPFQRWSRHYSWDNDTCNLITHLAHIEEWLIREFTLR